MSKMHWHRANLERRVGRQLLDHCMPSLGAREAMQGAVRAAMKYKQRHGGGDTRHETLMSIQAEALRRRNIPITLPRISILEKDAEFFEG